MAQANPEKETVTEQKETASNDVVQLKDDNKKNENTSFKFNVAAREFVPRWHTTRPSATSQVPVTGYLYPWIQYADGGNTTTGSWIYVADSGSLQHLITPGQATKSQQGSQSHNSNGNHNHHHHHQKDLLSDELKQKIIKQVEYQFSDMSLLANEPLVRQVNKDPEGFVPIAVVASTKKLKSLNISHQLIAQALRSSSKVIVSNDSKKVKRKSPFMDKDKEDLQLRTVVAENLPDDHSHRNIEKVFNVVGSVKTIRICQPQEPNPNRSKSDHIISHKLHALIEYENPETAEKAAEKLNDERNWRTGLRVRCLLRRSPKSVLKHWKSEFDTCLDDDEGTHTAHESHEDSSRPNTSGAVEAEEASVSSKKDKWGRGRGKSKQQAPLHTARSLPAPATHNTGSLLGELPSRHAIKGPRMPDGTRGFTMGRGKPLTVPVQSG